MTTPERHCTSSREGKGMLSCLIPVRLLQELDRALRAGGIGPVASDSKRDQQLRAIAGGSNSLSAGGFLGGVAAVIV